MNVYRLYLCIIYLILSLSVNAFARGVYFSGKGSIVPSRFSFSDSSGETNIASAVNLDLHAYSHIRPHSILRFDAFTDKKTIITPFRETKIEAAYSQSDISIFNRPLSFNCAYNLNQYDDQSSDPHDFKGMGFNFSSQYKLHEKSQVRTRYILTQRNARDTDFSFMNHLLDLQNKHTINRDINIVSGIMYVRNNAHRSFEDFIQRKFTSRLNYALPRAHRLQADIRLDFFDYQDNHALERNIDAYTVSYHLPSREIQHDFTISHDRTRFANISGNNFRDFSILYNRLITPDIHHGIIEHTANISQLSGNSAVQDYIDGFWEYYHETKQSGNARYYMRNRFGGRFWRNNSSSLPLNQHYIENALHTGIIIIRKIGGMLRFGPLVGSRQRIDPFSRQNSDSGDNPIIKNPWSNIFYGIEARTKLELDPFTSLGIFLDYRNFNNYNGHTSTELVNFELDVSHKLGSRLNLKAEFKYAQNINDLPNAQLDNSLLNIMLKLEYLFDLVL
ncbi:MAG: hypothetical protein ABII23_00305 [bacterium]